MSTTAVAAVNAEETDEIFLMLLTFDEATLADPIRVVNNTEEIVSNGETFLPVKFEIELPPEVGDSIQAVRLSIDNVDRRIVEAVRLATGRPTATLEIVLASDPDTVEAGPFDFELERADYDALVVTGQLSFDDVSGLRCPAHIVTPHLYPDLF